MRLLDIDTFLWYACTSKSGWRRLRIYPGALGKSGLRRMCKTPKALALCATSCETEKPTGDGWKPLGTSLGEDVTDNSSAGGAGTASPRRSAMARKPGGFQDSLHIHFFSCAAYRRRCEKGHTVIRGPTVGTLPGGRFQFIM
jgi:hypothetical protein